MKEVNWRLDLYKLSKRRILEGGVESYNSETHEPEGSSKKKSYAYTKILVYLC